ncbi:MAG: hypothetical protein K8R60_20355 [Burkholderiales bacterium]|nr:hypothetical protein [Burkholderiales bacterium]
MPDPATGSSISVVPIGAKVCKPFLIEVMVFSPESGYKFKVIVERSCTPEADELWKIVFDLYKIADGQEVQVVHVSYSTGTPVERKAVQAMATEGVKAPQAKVLVEKVHPAAKAVVGASKATKVQKKKLHDAMAEVLSVDV